MRFAWRAAPVTEGKDFDDSNPAMQARSQDIAAFYASSGLDHALTVHADKARLDQFRGKAARFNEPRMPKPLIEALLFR